jgi:hypothetical protein
VEEGLYHLDQNETMLVSLTPNKRPEVSGTLLARDGDALMEMVYGPHHWLTKAPPSCVELQRCWFMFPHISVKYSTSETAHRKVLFEHLKTMIRITLGIGLGEFRERFDSVYAEFQWDSKSGYRFFEISYSWVWTGSSRDRCVIPVRLTSSQVPIEAST